MRALLAGILVAAAFAGSAGGTSTRPKLWVKRLAPVRIDGSGFPAPARVVVSISTGTVSRSKRVRATSAGRIAASFTGVTFSRPQLCHGPALVAVARTKGLARVTVRLGGSSRDCTPIQPVTQ